MNRRISKAPDFCAEEKKQFEEKIAIMQPVPEKLIDKLEEVWAVRKNEILNTESEWELGENGRVFYISASDGDDTNKGTCEKCAFATIEKLHEAQKDGTVKFGDVVLFKRGDEWHHGLVTLPGVTYSAYGEGQKPRILGSIEADSPEQWLETDVPSLFVFNEQITSTKDVGNIVFNEGECYGARIIKSDREDVTMNVGDTGLHSNGIKKWELPIRTFTEYHELGKIGEEIPDADLFYYHDRESSKLYLYSREGNPGKRFWSVELCVRGHGVIAYSDVTLDNLCIKYAGSHGVSAGSCKNLTVRNCEVGWIGGAVQGETNVRVRFGNSVEIYGKADGYYVYNNYMYQAFDCGPTAQWGGTLEEGKKHVSRDIYFFDNVIREASLEVWYSSGSTMTDNTYFKLINCHIFNNLVTGSGTGFKAYNHTTNAEWCSFYGAGATNVPYIDCTVDHNYFWGLKRHILKSVPSSVKKYNGFKWENNVIIHPKDEGSIGILGEELDPPKGEKLYYYTEDTLKTLLDTGAFGFNYFYYTPGKIENQRRWGQPHKKL